MDLVFFDVNGNEVGIICNTDLVTTSNVQNADLSYSITVQVAKSKRNIEIVDQAVSFSDNEVREFPVTFTGASILFDNHTIKITGNQK